MIRLALLLVAVIQLSCSETVNVSYSEEVIGHEDNKIWTRLQITDHSMLYIAVGSFDSQRVMESCTILEFREEIKAQFELQDIKQMAIGLEDLRRFTDACAKVQNAVKTLAWIPELIPIEADQERFKRAAIDRTDPTTVRPTFLPEGNKLMNLLIYNGTVWCGTGNKATSFDDLGHYSEADQCCRTHDYCPYFIPSFTTAYNFSNSRPYTISACECDYRFYKCLRRAGTNASKEILKLFFDTISVPCFNIEYNRYCTDESSFFTCNKYAYGKAATLNYAISDIWKRSLQRTTLD